MQVLNGNGISGSASSVRDQLVAAGFVVDKVANASRFTYTKTTIYFKTGKDAEAELVKSALTGHDVESFNNDAVVGDYDVIVVVGKT